MFYLAVTLFIFPLKHFTVSLFIQSPVKLVMILMMEIVDVERTYPVHRQKQWRQSVRLHWMRHTCSHPHLVAQLSEEPGRTSPPSHGTTLDYPTHTHKHTHYPFRLQQSTTNNQHTLAITYVYTKGHIRCT